MRNKFSKSKRSRKQKVKGKRTRNFGSKRRSRRSPRIRERAPRTARELFARSKEFQETWTNIDHVISKMREDRLSLRKASKKFGVDPRIVARMARPALRKRSNGQYVAKASDRLLRVLIIPIPGGLQEIATRDSRQASLIANYWIALDRYLATGDSSALRKFDGKKIKTANGQKVSLLTDLAELDRLASAGVVSFQTIYAKR